MRRDALTWGLALGGGALVLTALRRSASAAPSSSGSTSRTDMPTLGDLKGAGTVPPPASLVPSSDGEPPAEPAPLPSNARPLDAPVADWTRRADAGAPLFIRDEVEALARVIASEVGRGTLAERVAIAWCARNRARVRGTMIARLVCSPCGKSQGNRRPFSTMQPASPATRELAAIVLASPQSEDPTQGATSCFEPALQDRLHREGRPGHRLDARGVRVCWLRGQDYYGSVGRWDLFGPKGGRGARAVPHTWNLAGPDVCCSGDARVQCRGKQPGDGVEA